MLPASFFGARLTGKRVRDPVGCRTASSPGDGLHIFSAEKSKRSALRWSTGRVDLHYLKWVEIAALVLCPVILLTLPRGGSAGFYLLLLCSLIGIACRFKPMGKSFLQVAREYWPINLAMAGMVCAIFFNHLSTGHFVIKTYDAPSRLALFALLFWILLLLSDKELKSIQWGLIAGTIVGSVALCIETSEGALRPLAILSTPINLFGNIVFLMGILTLFSIGWNRSNEKAFIALKLLAGGAGFYASYLSQTRGNWIVVPLFIVIGFSAHKKIRIRHQFTVLALAIVLFGSLYAFSSMVQTRVSAAQLDISHYINGDNLDTSIGIRFQLWKGAWLLFKENPFFGVGPERFTDALQALASRHVITPTAATFPHAHNDILFNMATLGIFGMLAILMLYFVPAFYFGREMRNSDSEVRTVASMGLALSLGFFFFGLTDLMFFSWTVSYTFYGVLLAAFFAHLVRRKAVLNNP